jgi:DNA-binding helix-hairpin-helix protein with protein kinase domain
MPKVVQLPAPGDRLHTADGGTIVIGEQIGMGGQGAVYRIRGTKLCAKVYIGRGSARDAALRQRLEKLRLLRADETLVLPRKLLTAPWVGYVMDLVEDAVPSSTLAVGQAPANQHYAATGGLRRRLLAGIQLAWAFQALHARGLAYCDLSFDNVYITRRGVPRVRLIDCDNLTVQGAPPPSIQGTPWFIAPEVLDGRFPPDSLTDAHSLAVLLYYMLVQTHPLLGDRVRQSPQELEQQALMGRWPFDEQDKGGLLPWVDDPEDERNRTMAGIPRELVLSRRLRETFQRAMGPGLLDRRHRPTEGRWAEVLAGAVDGVRGCPSCGHQSYYSKKRKCPWCDATLPPVAILLIQHPEGARPVVVERGRNLYPRHLMFRQNQPHEEPLVRVTASGKELNVENLGPEILVLSKPRSGGDPRRIPPGGSAQLGLREQLALQGKHPTAQLVMG